MSPGSELFDASFRLPVEESDVRYSRLPDLVLLDSMAYMVDVHNETTARVMVDGLHIQVSFTIAEPPRLSYCCVFCLDSIENPFDCVPRIISSVEDLVLIEVKLTTGIRQWFVYKAWAEPSLHVLQDLCLYSQKKYMAEAYGLMYHDHGLVLAALSYVKGQYNIHIFHSWQSNWTQELLEVDYGGTMKAKPINPTYVIDLGDGKLGWVDLWVGILICDVRALASGKSTVSRFIPLPKPLPRNQELYLVHELPRPIRNVTFSNGQVKCVELEKLVKLIPKAAPVVHDPSDKLVLYDSEPPIDPDQEEEDDEYEVVGWRLVTWFRELTWDHWRRGSMVHSDELGPISLPQPGGGLACAVDSVKDVQMCYPIMRGDDVVYLLSMQDKWDQTAWIAPVDTKSKSVSKPMAFSAHRYFLLNPTHIPCVLTKYLYTKPDAPPPHKTAMGTLRRGSDLTEEQ
ncbi:unnamed protein product [Alopecurus aequalis]